MRRIAYVTTSRSDYSPVYWLLRDLAATSGIMLHLLVGGAHRSEAHGLTIQEIEADGWRIAATLPASVADADPAGLAATDGALLTATAQALTRLQPDLLLLFGDRHELLAIAAAATLTRTPIAHISGGDLTHGAIDDSVRHAVTKLAHVHFPANHRSATRLRQMGEAAGRIHVVGDPALDHFTRGDRATPEALAHKLGFMPDDRTLLVTYHPETHAPEQQASALMELVAALESHDGSLILTGPAADPGHDPIRHALQDLARRRPRAVYVESLGGHRYRGALHVVGAMVGNSSSGLVEAPCVPLGVVNIGHRQAGRDRAANVIDTPAERTAISAAIAQALSPSWRQRLVGLTNPYGDGQAAQAITRTILGLPSRAELLAKQFVDTPPPAGRDAYQRPIGGDFALTAGALAPPPAGAWFATGRTALQAILTEVGPRRGYWLVPAFTCPSVPHTMQAMGCEVRAYPWQTPWQADLSALHTLLPEAAGILVPHYLGWAPDESIWEGLASSSVLIVEDRCQVPAMPPNPGALRGDYAFGSLRKWLPVPDGAYAVGRHGPLHPDAGRDTAWTTARLAALTAKGAAMAAGSTDLEAAAVTVTHAAEQLAGTLRGRVPASGWTEQLIQTLDIPAIQEARRRNLQALAAALRAQTPVTLLEPTPGFAGVTDLPALALGIIHPDRESLRHRLAEQRIFCPVHWRDGDWSGAGGPALAWAQSHLSLPIDHRYTPGDLDRLVSVLRHA